MQAADQIELAAVVAVNANMFIRHGRIYHGALEKYWLASKSRLEAWSRTLAEFSSAQQAPHSFASPHAALTLAWRNLRPVIEEILLSEILTRVWTGVAICYDRERLSAAIEPVVRSVYIGHQEARHRALNLMVYGRGFSTQEAVELNRLRRRCERGCDMVLAYTGEESIQQEFSFEPDRTADFARDLKDEYSPALNAFSWQMVLSSLRAAFHQEGRSSPHPTENEEISSAILSCFRDESFDSLGVLRSLWIERLQHIADDTAIMLEDLLSLEPAKTAATAVSASDRSARYRRI